MDAGFHLNVPADRYHADPCVVPSLSSSLVKVLLRESPRKAFFSHPRLNKDYREEHDGKFDIGTAAHSLLLEGDDCMHVVDANDWKTKAAQEARKDARAMGKLPLLAYQATKVRWMVMAAQEYLASSKINTYWVDADSEVTGVWREQDIWLRCRFDRITKNHRFIMDYKSTEDVSPDGFSRQIIRMGYHIQEAFYRRCARALGATGPRFVFIAQSVEPPHECTLHGCDPALQEIADYEIEVAVRTWRECITKKSWPSYGGDIHMALPATYMIRNHEQRLMEAA